MLNTEIARINEQDLKAINALEKSIGEDICLIAVRKIRPLFVLEAKLKANDWRRIDEIYPIENLKAFYTDEEEAKLAKGALKTALNGNLKNKYTKRPIRIRKIDSIGSEP